MYISNRILVLLAFSSSWYFFSSCGNYTKNSKESETRVVVKKQKTDQESDEIIVTNLFLVRHAEKKKSESADPELTKEGLMRAEDLSRFFEHINLDAVYSTNYQRTMSTAKPTAASKQLEILTYEGVIDTSFANQLLDKHKGKDVLIVGHSNSTPNLANVFMGDKEFESIDHEEYDLIYLVSTQGIGKTKTMILNYGKDSP